MLRDRYPDPRARDTDAEGNRLFSGVRCVKRVAFSDPAVNLAEWTLSQQGGATAALSGSAMQLSSGTAAGAAASATLGTVSGKSPLRVAVIAKFSQINPAGTDAAIELVDAGGNVAAAIAFPGGLSASQCRVQTFDPAGNGAPENSANVNYVDRVAAFKAYEILVFHDEIRFYARDTNSGAVRASLSLRTMFLPDPEADLSVRLRILNTAAVASSTTLMVHSVLVNDINELPVDMTNTGGVTPAESIPVYPISTLVCASYPAQRSDIGSYTPLHQSTLAASTNSTLVRSSPVNLGGGMIYNPSAADIWLKLYNKTSIPVPATDTPVLTVRVPANQQVNLSALLPAVGLRLPSGLAYSVTAAAAKTDATAIAAGAIIELHGV
ncbi:hypothetical protein [Paludibacterium paludis]|uniref:Uncharacterized protein n=1 Tax=Paludibacterium paludis TaxID=1225769 RepID=A0A918U6Q8_9NEIS|nr:hypothetical protein [Paludibacterium paludis]GGY03828.1 hypothetical protein GCM10011289_02710 [Paludibacterium paludis]